MEENKGFLYSTKWIIFFIFTISLLVAVLNHKIELKNNFSENIADVLGWEINRAIGESTYNNNIYNLKNIFSYYIKSKKVENYTNTTEYLEQNHISVDREVVAYNKRYISETDQYERITEFSDRTKLVEISDDGNFPNNNEVYNSKEVKLEEPRLKTSYLTNDRIFKREFGRDFKFDPKTIKFKEGYIVAYGSYKAGKVNFKTENLGADNKYVLDILDGLEEGIESVYSSIAPENGILELEFAYALNVNSTDFNSYINSIIFDNTFLPKLVLLTTIGLFIFAVFSMSTRYEKMKTVGFYEYIARFPIEIVISLLILAGSLVAIYFESRGYIEPEISLTSFFTLIHFSALFFTGISVYYFIYGIKDMYYKGFKSFLFKNSIVVRIFRGIKNKIITTFLGLTNNMEGSRGKTVLIAYGILLLVGLFGSMFFVEYNKQFLVFILWIALITLIFIFLKKYYDEIREIERVSENIAKGNYEVKLDEEKSNFRTLSHNLNTVSSNLDSAVEEALKSERMKTELITNVSHDLKTPLTSIINYSELLMADEINEEDIKNYSNIINEKSHKLKTLIENLFEVSKVSSKSIVLNNEDLDFSQLVLQVLGEWEDKLLEKDLNLNVNIPDQPVILNLDGNQTYRILENLFSNIYKYALENTRVYVDLFKGDKVELVIKNISKYPLNISADELLERFTRGDASRSTEGSGLGLSIASSLTELQGGEFKINIDGDLYKTTIKF